MSPPQLAADAPVAFLGEPVEIRVRVARGHELHLVIDDSVHGHARETWSWRASRVSGGSVGLLPPLTREARLGRLAVVAVDRADDLLPGGKHRLNVLLQDELE